MRWNKRPRPSDMVAEAGGIKWGDSKRSPQICVRNRSHLLNLLQSEDLSVQTFAF